MRKVNRSDFISEGEKRLVKVSTFSFESWDHDRKLPKSLYLQNVKPQQIVICVKVDNYRSGSLQSSWTRSYRGLLTDHLTCCDGGRDNLISFLVSNSGVSLKANLVFIWSRETLPDRHGAPPRPAP